MNWATHKQVSYIFGMSKRAGYADLDAVKVAYLGKGMRGEKLLRHHVDTLIDGLQQELSVERSDVMPMNETDATEWLMNKGLI